MSSCFLWTWIQFLIIQIALYNKLLIMTAGIYSYKTRWYVAQFSSFISPSIAPKTILCLSASFVFKSHVKLLPLSNTSHISTAHGEFSWLPHGLSWDKVLSSSWCSRKVDFVIFRKVHLWVSLSSGSKTKQASETFWKVFLLPVII